MSNLDKITLNHYEAGWWQPSASLRQPQALQQMQMMNEDSEYNFDYRR